MASWNSVAEELLRTTSSLDADVRFRSLVLQQQCNNLQAIYENIYDLETSLVEKTTAQQEETLEVERSIQDAIRRARQVRAELVPKGDTGDSCSDEEHTESLDADDKKLQNIMAVAKATRTTRSSERLERKLEPLPKARLVYPRKLKALETQLQELQLKEKEASSRYAFCCKMSEYVSLSSQRRQLIQQQQQKFESGGRMDVPVSRIQASFPKQVARLRQGYQRLTDFVLKKIEVGSPHFRHVAEAPTFSSVFPIYHRLKQAKMLLRLLNSEARALLERLPASPPKLSTATVAHREAMLSRIRRKISLPEDEALQAAAKKPQSKLHADQELLEKLQLAWAARVVLTELSNVVLWSFKTCFADTAEQPDASQVEAVMRLVRLVDSVALSQGRAYRSVVTPRLPA
ncbi:uncharacterized protein PITG_03003 [Phytophthora infestans T30-4]|uniref:Uncharacterized protein n=1 Tax=Phytophthora infestans (strain T30-4) TaxID=403677 RepID=D0MZ47_PHYIT|nr:uncharacterized protein PITG_19791 [Phytophthora infestans T30-4]XP_002906109.1 uncharacterized protein PITG_03003 [Phytophthora infestans T30-4]EEY55101.1 conserved hypothetical protein [Phytophthora infestans T30-4]EEY65510.1 conserved hypothetical protein [Phytophthora infestans T30-4]|eukprot:XP_002895706.1 conserved hypothetical protein [Phytophthora infestans T30-4]